MVSLLFVLGCAHAVERPSPSGAGTYVFIRYHAPCMVQWQCVDPPLIRSAVILLDEPISPESTCSARQGFTSRGCYIEDASHGSDPRPVAWRVLPGGELEVGLGCGLDSTVLVTLSGDEGRVRNFVEGGIAADWPIEIKAASAADATACPPP